MIFPFIPQ